MNKLLLVAALSITAFLQGGGQPIDIPIQDPPHDTMGYGAVWSQDLGVTPIGLQTIPPGSFYPSEGIYTLTFSVVSTFPHYPGYFTAKLSFGTQELCESSGWSKSISSQITVVCPIPDHIVTDNSEPGGGPPQGSNHLIVTWSVDVWPIPITSTSLTFTPTLRL